MKPREVFSELGSVGITIPSELKQRRFVVTSMGEMKNTTLTLWKT
jgi:hypothetical protein